MKVGTLLLDQNDNYLVKGELPKRPSFDKAFLKALCTQQTLTRKGIELLPPSIIAVRSFYDNEGLLIGIKEISEHAHLLIIVRSSEAGEGKKFRFDNFKKYISTNEVELWVRQYVNLA